MKLALITGYTEPLLEVQTMKCSRSCSLVALIVDICWMEPRETLWVGRKSMGASRWKPLTVYQQQLLASRKHYVTL